MVPYLGDFLPGVTVIVPYNTTDQGGSSITKSTDGTVRIYKGTSTTQRSSASGITDSEDFDTVTGMHLLSIDLSDNTDAGFYAVGNDYLVALVSAVVDTETISAWLGHFSILNRANSRPAQAAVIATLTGTPTTTSLASTSELQGNFANDVFIGRNVYILDGTYAGEFAAITDYVDASGTLTVETLPGGAPSAGDKIVIL